MSRSSKNANDFYFVGKTKSLTDGMKTKIFSSEVGFVMKAFLSLPDESCFNYPSSYSLLLPSVLSLNLINLGWIFDNHLGSNTLT